MMTASDVSLRPLSIDHAGTVEDDGIDYPLTGTYLDIVRPERLVMTCSVKGHPADWHALVRQNRGRLPANPLRIATR